MVSFHLSLSLSSLSLSFFAATEVLEVMEPQVLRLIEPRSYHGELPFILLFFFFLLWKKLCNDKKQNLDPAH